MLYFLKSLVYNRLAVSMTELGCMPITGRYLGSGRTNLKKGEYVKC